MRNSSLPVALSVLFSGASAAQETSAEAFRSALTSELLAQRERSLAEREALKEPQEP